MDGELEEAAVPVLGQEQGQEQGGVDDEAVGVVVEGNVQAEEVGNDRTHQVGSSRMEGDHSFRIDSGEEEVRMWQADQVVECDSGVKGVAAAVARWARTNNCHDGHTVYDRMVVALEKPG